MEDVHIQSTTEHATCACGESDDVLPELDVQTIPHAIRHAAIFGVVESLPPGAGFVISATHNPVPLLTQLAARHGDTYQTTYLADGPERWRIRIARTA